MTTSVLELQVQPVLPRSTPSNQGTVAGWLAPTDWNFRQRHPLIVEIVFVITLVLLLAVNG